MSALSHHENIRAQVIDRVFQVGCDLAGSSIIAREQAVVGGVPTFGAKRPVFPSGVENLGRGLDQIWKIFHLARVEGVNNVRVLLVEWDGNSGIIQFSLEFLLHPLDSLDVVFFSHAHVVASLEMHIDGGFQAFGGHVDGSQHGARGAYNLTGVHTHRAVDDAASTHSARPESGHDQLFDHLLVEVRSSDPAGGCSRYRIK